MAGAAVGNGEPDPSDSLRGFGALVKLFRKRAGLTQEQLAPRVGWSQAQVASIEQGRRFPSQDFIDRAEEHLDACGALKELGRHLARQPGLASWFREWAGIEETAVSLCVYECRVVPGLLQTESYARAVLSSTPPPLDDEQIESLLSERLARQDLLAYRPLLSFSSIIEQSTLERCTGGVEVMRAQIEHLLRCSEMRNVEIQLMPTRQVNHAGLAGPLQLAETSDQQWLGYFEGQRGSQLISCPKDISVLLRRYAIMRTQALTPDDTTSLLERMRGEL